MSWGLLKQTSHEDIKIILCFGHRHINVHTHTDMSMYASAKITNWNKCAHTFACVCADRLENKHKEAQAHAQMPLSISCCQCGWSISSLHILPLKSAVWPTATFISYMQGKKYLLIPANTLWFGESFLFPSFWPHEIDEILICAQLMTTCSNAKNMEIF